MFGIALLIAGLIVIVIGFIQYHHDTHYGNLKGICTGTVTHVFHRTVGNKIRRRITEFEVTYEITAPNTNASSVPLWMRWEQMSEKRSN